MTISKDVRSFGIYAEQGTGVVRAFRFPVLSWAGDWRDGAFWLGTGGLRLLLKAPWCRPLFSERAGTERHFPIGFGWRARFCRVATAP